jgi:DeoR/GlpR family transcriptional regulator of sugar metabolism
MASPGPTRSSAITRSTCSAAKIFVGTHTKSGLSSFSRFADVEELDALVTGGGLASRTAGRYQASGVRVVPA